MYSLQPPFFQEVQDSRRILIAGMGGGFDVFCGLPLYFALKADGKEVFLANYSFTSMDLGPNGPLPHAVVPVTPDLSAQPGEYFPEYWLSRWLVTQGEPGTVYAFRKVGVQPLKAAYEALITHLKIDTVILVDGGTDSLMRGDEVDLGTPHEDATSLVAVNELRGPKTLLACLGFGIDRFHGVCHANYLEATAELTRSGAYLGAFSLTPDMPPVQKYKEACEAVFQMMPRYTSIVNSSIIGAIDGHYGDHHATSRTHGSELWINPLMGLYWTYHLPAVASRLQYYQPMLDTVTLSDVGLVIERHRDSVPIQPRVNIPV
ncbi:hypothetical protein GCM10008959_08940 [Deinococcus seoulensis]|uniref:DUF1152 domain-containing protein n=1 Tax=Deinococcus seoulensis TaxID=1837379 RepID=A0ABQ2RMN3_9DEIO|nr:DUF1152 domain-containing protein [Deinococcus seoulensis]GGR50022.1 hypothetical protein GCM10008959_08940 [Deinococcus seoulensis]